MRIIKLGTGEFSNLEQVESFFEDDLPLRSPPGKFLLPSSRLIGKTGLSKGEKLLFAFKGTVCYSALAGSERSNNLDNSKSEYPFYFLIDMATLKRVNFSLTEIEEILHENKITMSIVRARSWPVIKDPGAADLIRQLTDNRVLSKTEAARKKYGAGGEGLEHKRLKEWIANNPESIGLKNVRTVEVEHSYLSGDSVDILFELTTNTDVVVEIETTDPLPGCHQAIKYRVLRCAERGLPLSSTEVQPVIVAWKIPPHVIEFCKKYNIRHVEKKL